MSKALLYGIALMGMMSITSANNNFKDRAEEAKKRWHDAKNLPRKAKKRVRKEAQIDYTFYMEMIEWDELHFKF